MNVTVTNIYNFNKRLNLHCFSRLSFKFKKKKKRFFTSQSTIFQLCWDGSSWVEPVLGKGRINVSCSSTQYSDVVETPTCNLSIQALYH